MSRNNDPLVALRRALADNPELLDGAALQDFQEHQALDMLLEFWHGLNDWAGHTARINLSFFKKPLKGRVLDIGAGSGMVSHLIQDAHPASRIVACDIEPEGMALAHGISMMPNLQILTNVMDELRRRIDMQIFGALKDQEIWYNKPAASKRASGREPKRMSRPLEAWVKGGVPDIPLPDSSFDAVMSFQTYHYTDDPRTFFSEARRLGKNHAHLYMSDVNPFQVGGGGFSDRSAAISVPQDAPGASTLDTDDVRNNPLVGYMQKILVFAAMQGYEIVEIATGPYAPSHREERSGRPHAEFISENDSPVTAYFHFAPAKNGRIKVPEAAEWIPHFDGTIPASHSKHPRDAYHVRFLPGFGSDPAQRPSAERVR